MKRKRINFMYSLFCVWLGIYGRDFFYHLKILIDRMDVSVVVLIIFFVIALIFRTNE